MFWFKVLLLVLLFPFLTLRFIVAGIEQVRERFYALTALGLERHLLQQVLNVLRLQEKLSNGRPVAKDAESVLAVRSEKRSALHLHLTVLSARPDLVLLDAVLEELERQISRLIMANEQKALKLVVAVVLQVFKHVSKYSLLVKLFWKHLNEAIAVDDFNWRVSSKQVLQLLG